MAVANYKNRIVGFAIVASTILIFLPVILSKDMISRETPNSVAISEEGAVVNQVGQLQLQGTADMEKALNIKGENPDLNALALKNQNGAQNVVGLDGQSTITDNGVETLEFSRPEGSTTTTAQTNTNAGKPSATLTAQNALASEEAKRAAALLTANAPATKPQAQQATKPASSSQGELLVANNRNTQPPKPAIGNNQAAKQTPQPKVAPAKAAPGTKNLAGSKPAEKYVVQVGVFSKKDNANNVIAKLKSAGINVYAVEINSDGRSLYRIYGGRSNNKNDLTDLVGRIDKLCGTKSKIVSL